MQPPSSPSAPDSIFLDLLPQPTDTTCGPTCLHGLYRFYGRERPLERIIREVETAHGGGTLSALLGNHALHQGFAARIYTWNLRVFDPTWFPAEPGALAERLRASLPLRRNPKLRQAIQAFIRFCDGGGEVRMEVLTGALIRRYLHRGRPVLAGLSSTFLYGDSRKNPETNEDHDLGGEAEGHFVVLTGYEPDTRTVHVADPYADNPFSRGRRYTVTLDRLINAILLGVLSHDCNLLILEPKP